MTTTANEMKELQSVWDKAVESASMKASGIPFPSAIPEFNLKELSEWSQCIEVNSKLRSVFEQLLQNYLNHNETSYSNRNVLVLLDIAITISLNTSHSSSSFAVNDKFYFFVITLLDTFCEYLTCDQLSIIVFYLTKRTKVLCTLSKQWELKFKSNHKSTNNLELPILKFCNKVLFRLSDIAKRGQFLVFMSNFVDIDSRSGQNFLGQFHLENITKTDEYQAKPHRDATRTMDDKLYKAVWGLQEIFNDPRLMGKSTNSARFAQFRQDLDLVLECFKKNAIDMDEAMGHFTTVHNGYYHCKYLTSLRLFDKQLYNPSFRRYILVQSLILLSSHRVDVPSEHPKLTPFIKFGSDEKHWIQSKYVEIMNAVLPSIPPNGATFTKFIQSILQRDENWLVWKYNKKDSRCNKLKREWISSSRSHQEPPLKKRRRSQAYAMGNKNLCDVFKWTPKGFQSKRNNADISAKSDAFAFLNDYQLIDFKEKLNERLHYLVTQYDENHNNKVMEALLTNEKTVFTNLRIMRDLHHEMFAQLCPMANNPEPKTFKCQFVLDALKYHSPKTFANESNGYHSRKYSRSKPKTPNSKR